MWFDLTPMAVLAATSLEEGGEIANLVAPTSEASEATPASPPTPLYWQSGDATELIVCVGFFVLCALPTLLASEPWTIRPIPVQQLVSGSGEYVLNQVLNEQLPAKETVNTIVLVVVSMLIPLAIQSALTKCMLRNDETHASICTYLLGLALTLLSTELLKLYAGYLRPVFYQYCQPNADYTDCSSGNTAIDARKSFPSGHASFAVCGLTLFSLYLQRTFGTPQHPGDDDDDARKARLYSVFSLTPIGIALFIGASRVVDNKHFPADVVGGSVLGAACAIFSFRLWFPARKRSQVQ